MSKKRMDSRKKIEEINKDDVNIKVFEKILLIRIFKLLIWWFIIVAFLTTTSLIVLGVYYVVKHSMAHVEVPQMDMNKYWGTYPMDPKQDVSIRPYKIEFSNVMINDLRERLLHQRPFQPPLEESGFVYGFNSYYLTKVLDFWKNKYDFKGRENFFNKYDHYITNIQGLNIHYMHVQPAVSSDFKVLTLLLLHSWPGSIREFYEIIPKLTTPHPKYKFVFEIIAPSLPGFGFSQAPARPGMHPTEMAIVVSNLMNRIGRSKYYVQGGDIGHSVGSVLATLFPKNVLGFHTSTPKIYHPMIIVRTVLAFLLPSIQLDPEIPTQTFSVHNFLRRAFEETGYLHIQATKPDTIGIALTDSPAGLAAYIIEKFSLLTNPEYQKAEDGNLRNKFSLTQLLDNVMVYWVTNSITSSMRVHAEYYDTVHSNLDLVETEVPTWGLKFKHYLTIAPLSVIKRKYKNYLHTTVADDGGNFAAMEHPEILGNDIFAAVDTFMSFHTKNNNPQGTTPTITKKTETIYDFSVTDIHGKEVQLSKYRGYTLLIVNVASQCGLTDKNYQQLIELYEKYEDKGLRILAFPCNQFGYQEPGSSEDIIQFTQARGVRFDVFSKIEVNGENTHPLWKFLKRTQSGNLGDWIKWNFSKFIVDRNGVPVERFGPHVDPYDIESYIDKYINLSDQTKHEDL